MPRSSRHKSSSHKQSKHSSKEATKEYSDSDEELNVKMKERNGKEESSGGGSGARVPKDLASGEKRKLASQSRESKDLSGHGNGDASVEDYVFSKRRKEKADGNSGADSWNDGGDDRGDGPIAEKESKGESSRVDSDKGSKAKALGDSKSKTSKRHESSGEKEKNVSAATEKEDNKSNRVDSKRKSDKETGRKEYKDSKESKEIKEKERGSDRKVQDVKHDTEARVVDVEVARKQTLQSTDGSKDKRSKRGRENVELSIHDEVWIPGLEKESDKKTRRRRDESSDKYEDDTRETDDRRQSSKGDRAKDGRYGDERHKDGNSVDKYREDGDKRYRDEKYHEDVERDERHRESKHREDGERDSKRRDDKNWEDGERDDKYCEVGDRESRRRDDKYREDVEKESRRRDDKYREDGGKDSRRSNDRYHEGDREDKHSDDRNRDDGDRNNRHNEKRDRDNSHKEEKYREDVDRDARHRDGRLGDEIDKEKRLRDAGYRERRTSRDRASDKYVTKRLRDEISAADLHHRNSNNWEGSPSYEDRIGRHKDDQGRRRASDKEDYIESRSHGAKEHRLDAEKRSMISAKPDIVIDRGRSSSWNADVELSLNHGRRRNSPSSSSQTANDHYRHSKQEESKFKDYLYEDRMQHTVSSVRESAGATGGEIGSLPCSVEKPIQKDDSYFGDLPVDRRLKLESRASPLQRVDKSPSSASTERRYLNRSDARRNFDVEESGQRSGSSKDAKEYSAKEGKGSRELTVDEISQADGDNVSVSSPYPRNGNFSGNSKSLFPPPHPFRTGIDSPVAFGSADDDNRGKSNSRHKRMGDANMGRGQGNAWKGVPNWSSPVANGFVPFQHGPPPVGFHPVMQQFPAPPVFGVRPGMELNHAGVPYHMSDADRFPGHGHRLGWRNHMDDSYRPLHGWDSNNPVFADESHIYGRLDWDNGRNQMSSRGWEASGDMWKRQNSVMNGDLPTASQKDSSLVHGSADEVWPGKSGQQAANEQKPTELQAESIDINKSSDVFERNTPEAPKSTTDEGPGVIEMSKSDKGRFCQVYLSKLDISAELAQPELYSECIDLMNICPKTTSNEDYLKILYVEKAGVSKAQIPPKTLNAFLFAAISDSVFQKAMSIYKRHREDTAAIDKASTYKLKSLENVLPVGQETASASDSELGKLDSAYGHQEAEGDNLNSVLEKAVSPLTVQEVEMLPLDAGQSLDGEGKVKVTPESVVELETSSSLLGEGNMESNQVANQEQLGNIVKDKILPAEIMGSSDALSPCMVEGIERSNGHGGNCLSHNNKEQKLLFCDVCSEACEAIMPESVESGLVNLSRIHHSPESTH